MENPLNMTCGFSIEVHEMISHPGACMAYRRALELETFLPAKH